MTTQEKVECESVPALADALDDSVIEQLFDEVERLRGELNAVQDRLYRALKAKAAS